MSDAKHTPGPWRTGREDMQSYEVGSGQPFSSVYASDPRGRMHLGQRLPIAVCRVPGEEIDRDEEKANARLIAAAPELLESMQEIVDAWDGMPDGAGIYRGVIERMARAALAKATGKEPR